MTDGKSKGIKNFSDHESFFKEKTGNDFSFYYKKYYPKLIYYIQKFCGDEQESEDISTDSFMTAFEKIEMFDSSKAQFSTWLFIIARNIVLQKIKERNKHISIDIEFNDDSEEGRTTLKEFISEEETFDNERHELTQLKYEIMLKHIDELDEPYKEVIEMRELDKMSYKSIADELNLNLSTLKSRIRNARIQLMENTKKEFDQLDEMYM